ncbi:MAG: hypothetical protein KTR21_10225 [Rhodobacteraceae bacterium]|nr:hypothetical protein [Paracoccaceae bacterium]
MSLQGDQPHLAAEFSLADIFVATVTHYIGLTPEGAAPLEARPVVGEWISRITSRPSYANAAYDLGF